MRLSDLLAEEYGATGTLVAGRGTRDFLRPTGASAWCVQDLLFHQLLDAQRALVAIASPSDAEPDRDAVTYWQAYHPTAAPAVSCQCSTSWSGEEYTEAATRTNRACAAPPSPRSGWYSCQ